MGEENHQLYYYHGDRLGSAQLVTDPEGKIYEQLEYTPYGELWVEHLETTIETTPFRFTGKERDSETGLYYLNPQTSMWLSADPAMGEYIPQAPINDKAKQHNKELPGMGGVFNYVNLHVYHYAGNNPVRYVDPNGRDIILDDPTTRDAVLADITLVAGAGFYFDSNNNLQLDDSIDPGNTYSSEMRDAFKSLIDGEYKDQKVYLLYSKEAESHEPGGTGINFNLGFTMYGDSGGKTFRIGVPHPLFKNDNGQSAAILIHEWLGHLMPTLKRERNVNAVQRTMPIIRNLKLSISDFGSLNLKWAPGVPHDGAIGPVKQ